MENLTEKDISIKPPRIGEIMDGKIVGRGRSSVYVDLGALGTGIIYGKEFYEAKENLKSLKIGDQVFTKVIDLEDEDGYIELSLSGASKELTWDALKQKKADGDIISVKILGANKGGLLAEVSGIQAFLPVSQLSPEHYPRIEGADSNKILKELQKFINQELAVKIFDLDPREGKLILSEKAKETEKIRELLKNYKVGDVIDGEITGITDFGAFIKFSSSENSAKDDSAALVVELEGLIHISELDWQLIENPAEIVKTGEKVKAKIIDISNDKVSLSLKALKKDPWIDIEKDYKKGDPIKGLVTKFNPFGAFVKITPEIQGLCHISEFGTKSKMEEFLKIGEKYDFQILEIRPEDHKMSLKLTTSNR